MAKSGHHQLSVWVPVPKPDRDGLGGSYLLGLPFGLSTRPAYGSSLLPVEVALVTPQRGRDDARRASIYSGTPVFTGAHCLVGVRRARRNEANLFDGYFTEQRLDQWAIRARSIAALRHDLLQHALHTPQIGDLCPHVH